MSERQNLELTLGLNGVQLVEQGLARVAASVERVGKSIKEGVLEFAPELAALMGGTAIVEGVHTVLEYGRALEVLQAQTGASIPDLVILQRLLMLSGVQADEAGMMIARMQRALVEASQNAGSEAFAAFHKLFGDDAIGKLGKMDVGEQFRAIGTALGQLGDQSLRSAYAQEIFGRSGYQLLRIFPKLAEYERSASQGHQEFANVMSRGGDMFRNMEVGLQMFGETSKEFFAGVLDSVGPMFDTFFQKLSNIDLTGLGQKVGAFFGVILQSVKDDKFPEMIGLLVEAGFELGKAAAERVFIEIVDFFGSKLFSAIALSLADLAMTFGIESAKLLVTIFREPVIYMAAAFDWAFDHIRELAEKFGNQLKTVFAVAMNYWAAGIENLLNKLKDSPFFVGMMEAINPGIGASLASGGLNLGRMNETQGTVKRADSWHDDAAAAREAGLAAQKGINQYLDDRLKKSMEILRLSSGITAEDKTDLDALTRLTSLMNAFIAKRQAIGAGEGGKSEKGGPTGASELLLAALEAERRAKERIAQIDGELGRLETDYTMTTQEKWAVRKQLLEEEREELGKIVASMQARAKLMEDINPQQAQSIRGEIPGVERQQSGVDKQLGGMGPDPNNFVEQFTSAMTKLKQEWGTLAQSMAEVFSKSMNTGIDAVSAGLTRMITTTQRWNLSLYQVAQTIMTSVVQSIIRMAAEWITQHILMAAVGKMLQAMGVASTASSNAIIAATAAPAATMNTIATYGGAAAAAPGLIGSAIGETMSESFAQGGYTGDGGKYDMAGIVHRGEFVMPADAVSRIGLPRLTAMKDGSATVPGVAGGDTHLHVWPDEHAASEAVRNNPRLQHAILGIVSANSHKVVARQA